MRRCFTILKAREPLIKSGLNFLCDKMTVVEAIIEGNSKLLAKLSTKNTVILAIKKQFMT